MNCELTTTAIHFVTPRTREHVNVRLTAQHSATDSAAAGGSCQTLCTHRPHIRTRIDYKHSTVIIENINYQLTVNCGISTISN